MEPTINYFKSKELKIDTTFPVTFPDGSVKTFFFTATSSSLFAKLQSFYETI